MIQVVVWFTALVACLLYASSGEASTVVSQSITTATGLALTVLSRESGLTYSYQGMFGTAYGFDVATAYFGLSPVLDEYASCPKCSKLHHVEDGRFLEHCIFKDLEGRQCGASLATTNVHDDGRIVLRPRRRYEHQRLGEWLGCMMARPETEEWFARAVPRDRGDHARDIWEADHVRKLRRNGKSFWQIPQSEDMHEGRLLFGLAVDGYNAHHSVAGKKTWSVGAIFLVCFNLPPHLRFKRENICLVGIIPGPKEPSTWEIQHFLQPLVNDLLDLWTTGIWFTRTYHHTSGRLMRGALGPVVCDLAAARPVAGFMGFRAMRFCSTCMLHLHKIAVTLKLVDLPLRSPEAHRKQAGEWMDARSESKRKTLQRQHGVRWTCLLALEYWDPVTCTALDVMHNGFLGNLSNHIRSIWGQNITLPGGDGSVVIHRLPVDAKSLRRGRLVVEMDGRAEALMHLDPGTLEYFCWERNLMHILGPNPTKENMVNEIIRAVSGNCACTGPLNLMSIQRPSDEAEEPSEEASEDALLVEEALLVAIPRTEWVAKAPFRVLLRACNRRLSAGQPQYKERATSIEQLVEFLAVSYNGVHDTLCLTGLGQVNAPELDVIEPDEDDPESLELAEQKKNMKVGSRVVLGCQTMDEVYKDMGRTAIPSWLKRPPRVMGSASHGKLSADQWRVCCMVNYPITLIRLWGAGQRISDENPRYLDMLDNFIHLVLSIKLATKRSTSPGLQERVLFHTEHYLSGLRRLYPGIKVLPNNHFALHLPKFLRLFGPPHAWWAFPFERLIGILQGFRTNSRLGTSTRPLVSRILIGFVIRPDGRNCNKKVYPIGKPHSTPTDESAPDISQAYSEASPRFLGLPV